MPRVTRPPPAREVWRSAGPPRTLFSAYVRGEAAHIGRKGRNSGRLRLPEPHHRVSAIDEKRDCRQHGDTPAQHEPGCLDTRRWRRGRWPPASFVDARPYSWWRYKDRATAEDDTAWRGRFCVQRAVV